MYSLGSEDAAGLIGQEGGADDHLGRRERLLEVGGDTIKGSGCFTKREPAGPGYPAPQLGGATGATGAIITAVGACPELLDELGVVDSGLARYCLRGVLFLLSRLPIVRLLPTVRSRRRQEGVMAA